MTVLQTHNNQNQPQSTNALISGLSDYGLCPAEWLVTKEHGTVYKIENLLEPGFFFRGKVKFENGRKKWISIHLAGI